MYEGDGSRGTRVVDVSTVDTPKEGSFLLEDQLAVTLSLGFSFTDAISRRNAPSDV
jgi:hypothetical protein